MVAAQYQTIGAQSRSNFSVCLCSLSMIMTVKYGFYTFGNPIAWIPKMGQVIIDRNKKLCFVFLYLGCSRGVEPSIGIIY